MDPLMAVQQCRRSVAVEFFLLTSGHRPACLSGNGAVEWNPRRLRDFVLLSTQLTGERAGREAGYPGHALPNLSWLLRVFGLQTFFLYSNNQNS